MQMAPQEIRPFFVGAVTWGRRPISRAEPMARLFLDALRNYRAERRYLLHESVFMPEHFHLLLTPAPDVSLEKAVQWIKGGFSFRVKHELGSALEVWQPGAPIIRCVSQPLVCGHRQGWVGNGWSSTSRGFA